jgi:transcription elongation factor
MQSSSSSYKTLFKQFKNVPRIINPSKIDIITDIGYLSQLENKYDIFLEKNMQLLDLYNVIDDLLDIRDAITIQICRLKRKRRLSEYYQTSQSPTAKQKEYKCGCTVQEEKNNKKQITIIQHQYCPKHLHYLKTKQILETELIKINQELSSITKKENEL